jgi:N-methylhydantoinase A
VHRVANATMARALRAVSTERGRDPRDLHMLAFGGNGPVHAATLARLLDIRRILIPPLPGLFSALGMLFPETEHHYVRTHKRPLAALDLDALDAAYRVLEAEGAAILREEGFSTATHRFERLLDLRYAGANAELTLPCPAAGDAIAALGEAFARQHLQHYGYRSDEEAVETMNLRVIARAAAPATRVPERLAFEDVQRPGGARRVYFGPERGAIATQVCARDALGGDWTRGPLLVEEFDSTTVVPPDARVRRIAWDTIEIELD